MSFVTAIPWSAHALGFGADLAAKVTVLLGVGLLVQQFAAHWRASLGSTVANACLLGLLLVPCSALLLPTIKLAWLPAASGNLRPHVRALPEAHRGAVDWDGDASFDPPGVDRNPITSMAELRSSSGSTASVPASSHAIIAPPSSVVLSSPTRRIDWLLIGMAGYAAVAGLLLVRLLASLVAVARLRNSSPHVADGPWWLALESCRRRLGINRPVGLAWSPCVGVPVVLGWLRPTIVLPATLPGISPDGHADAVLLHELSHVRRADYPWHVLSKFVQAVYWPHPLVWLLGRAMAEMRERACDELCVHELGGPSRYREALLAVAQGVSHRASPALGLAMARCSRLGQRLARIEQSQGQALCVPSLRVRLAIAGTAVVASATLGTIQLAQAQVRTIAAVVPVPDAEVAKGAQPQAGAGRMFHLRVVAADTGKPVANADVRLWIAYRDEWQKTDAEGRLDIVYATGPGDSDFAIDVWGEGRAMQRHDWGLDPKKPVPDGETIRLQPGESLGGIVQDEAGRPIAGATVLLWSHNYRNRGSGSNELLFDLRAVSGPDGRWHTSGAPQTTGELLGFRIDHPDYLSVRDYGDKEIIPKIADLRGDKAVTVMKKGVPIEGRVVDVDGKPVAGARVLSMSHERAMFVELKRFAAFTDVSGRFRTGQVKSGEWILVASAAGHGPGDQRVRVATAVPQVEIKLGRRTASRVAWSIRAASRSPARSSTPMSGRACIAAWAPISGLTPTAASAGTMRPKTS